LIRDRYEVTAHNCHTCNKKLKTTNGNR
jgi:hypothetical protein